MRFIKVGAWVLFTLFLLAIAVALIGQNTEALTVTLFTYTTSLMPKWVLLLGCLFLGALLASLFFIVELIVLETKNIRLRRQNRMLAKALDELREGQGLAAEGSEKAPRIPEEDDLSDV
jgi:uncharacterized integral membrane protein